MANTCAGTHHLHITRFRTTFVTQTVLVADRPFTHIRNDLHIGMIVRRKPGVGRNRVVIPDTQGTPAHASGIVVIGKRKMVLGV